MRLHLTPSFETTPQTIKVMHCYNTDDCRVYNIDFKNPVNGCTYKSIIIHVPFDITQSVQFYTLEHCDIDEDEKDCIKELFYMFCHNLAKETPKYAYVHHIKWHDEDSCSHNTLPTELNIDISTMNDDNVYMEIQNVLERQFGHKPRIFSAVTYAPFE